MTEKQLSGQTVAGLAAKLDEFGEVLTTDEKAVLLGLLGAASSTIDSAHRAVEAEGGSTALSAMHSNLTVSGRLPKLSDALRGSFTKIDLGLGGGQEVQDSIGVGVSCVSWSKDYNKEMNFRDRINPMEKVQLPQVAGIRTIR